jgi:hypothetical protein
MNLRTYKLGIRGVGSALYGLGVLLDLPNVVSASELLMSSVRAITELPHWTAGKTDVQIRQEVSKFASAVFNGADYVGPVGHY